MAAYTLEESLTKEYISKLRDMGRLTKDHVDSGGAEDYADYKNHVGYIKGLKDAEEVFLDYVKKYFP